ncbi:hypothetical protein J1N35_044962 [Gossypium stocksii]|uniref:RNase H type-1 domain-containing protein n=1 Tax=Gossypium stocksii TaxID=47602 RepID=A0A9D3UA52_9ROSI|nr:hypothetical protein J1N35_044962 [Gossypium stocksii]
MNAFREVLKDCNLNDLGFSGQWYTWERGRLAGNNIMERLDRGVANQEWWDLFTRYSKKKIKGLENVSGRWVTKANEISKIATTYFKDLFSSKRVIVNRFHQVLHHCIDDSQGAFVPERELDTFLERDLVGESGMARASISGMMHGYQELEMEEFNVSRSILDPKRAEARACLQAVTMAEEMGFQDICVEGDVLTLIRKLTLAIEDRSCIRSFIQEIKGKSHKFRSV